MTIIVDCKLCVMALISFSSAALCPNKAKWNYPVFWIGIPGNYGCEIFSANGRSSRANTLLECPYTRYRIYESLTMNGYKTSHDSPTTATRMSASTGKSFNGCLVQSNNPISVVAVNKNGGLIGGSQFRELKELGIEYLIMTANPNISTKPEFAIMAAFTGTKVSVRLPLVRPISVNYGGTTYTTGDWINDTLKDFQTMRIVTNKKDLTGSYVVSDKPVAVVAGDYETKVPIGETLVSGHVEESMPPIQELGRDYIAAPLIHTNYTCSLRILAVRNITDVTDVTISNITDTTGFAVSIPFNDVYDYDFNCELQLIRSNQEIMVGLFTQTGGIVGGKPSYFVLTPLEKAGNVAWFGVPDYYGLNLYTAFEHNYVNVIVKASDAGGIRVKNSGITSHFHQDIDVDGETYSAYSVPVSASSFDAHWVRHTSGGKFICYFEARKNDWRSYGYTLIPYQQGPDFLFWDADSDDHVTAINITYNSNTKLTYIGVYRVAYVKKFAEEESQSIQLSPSPDLNVKSYEATNNRQAKSFDPSTNVVFTDTSRAVAINKCKKTSCDLVSCTETNTCTLLYTPHYCEVYETPGSAFYKSSENEESCSAPPPS
ncbi:hypothetical protein LOTGIDRAFT_157135 [Lottia gigantea]|uniref:IgGFc-binding protein N-terminal domain-containing protein n=1 Tax=Lottia gigantea TaxID=225164 RepID=V4AWV6_LOTGI|nr:hypothetical protein LOTGIDRAFT_157135 [Lottia gigantea]ESP01998.1 hypothetical protein LOTGIDRAFT_157135 [Lottia gigantea]